jgi:hypothetical protein
MYVDAKEKAAIRAYLQAAKEAAYSFQWSLDGGDTWDSTTAVDGALKAICDAGRLNVTCVRSGHPWSYMCFILGRGPDKVLRKYGESLTPYMARVRQYA